MTPDTAHPERLARVWPGLPASTRLRPLATWVLCSASRLAVLQPRPHASNVRAPTYSSRNEESECSSHHGCLHFSLCPPPCACLPTCPPPTRRCRLDEGQQTSSLRCREGARTCAAAVAALAPLCMCQRQPLPTAGRRAAASCMPSTHRAVHANVSSRGFSAARQARRTLCDQPMRK